MHTVKNLLTVHSEFFGTYDIIALFAFGQKKNEEMFTEECKFDGFPHSMDGHHRSNKNFFGEIFSTAMVLQAILVSI